MKFLLTILLLLLSQFCEAQNFLSYYIKGRMRDREGRPMRNAEFIMESFFMKRSFVTDSKGNFFVEAVYVIGCRNVIEEDRNNNKDVLTFHHPTGSMFRKFNWEKYYLKDRQDSVIHNIWDSTKGRELVEVHDIKLMERIDMLKEAPYSREAESRKKLKEYNQLPRLDSLALGASMTYSRRTYPPDSLEMEKALEFVPTVWHKLSDGKEYIIEDGNPLLRYQEIQYDIEGCAFHILLLKELRNRHLNYIFTEDCLGNCTNIIKLKKVNDTTYDLLFNPNKKSHFLRLTVNKKGVIKDVVSVWP